MAAKNTFTIVIALMIAAILLVWYHATQREIMYDLPAIQGNFDDPPSFYHINAKSDSQSKKSIKNNPLADKINDHANKTTHSSDPQVITAITTPSQVLFPYPKITRQPHEILNSPWATNMKAKLKAAKVGKQLTFVTASLDYLPVLINWLIYARLNALPLIDNLLVVCLDQDCHEILSRKGILSQFVQVDDIIYSIKDMDLQKVFSSRVITRLTVLRLLNYWGYDVLVIDVDALLINNIQPIFDHFSDSDIIISTAVGTKCIPEAARNAWGFCLCMGFLLIRSNTNTERMWQAFGSTPVKLAGCDQTRFNTVLIESKLTWTPFDYNRNHYFSGTSQSKDITLIALPQEVVCRNECKANRLSSYYVYHPVTTQHASVKHQRLVARNVWKIDDHWKMTLDSIQSTMDWLNEVTV